MVARIAAVDVGSNSVRIAVMAVDEQMGLEVIEEARVTPRLIRDVEAFGRFTAGSIDGVVSVLADFRAIAEAAGARILAVATSAARDAANGDELVARVRRDAGIDLSVIGGEVEARLAFLGAVYSLPVTDGMVMDIGGGSLELVRFEDRRPVGAWTLPLGAVRLTGRFLRSDPTKTAELDALRKDVARQIADAALPPLREGEMLVGTGGTIRNIGKIHRARSSYPLTRLHGYTVGADEVRRVTGDIASHRSMASRREISGLNEDRLDTIVAGAMVAQAVVDEVRAPALLVSGQGLREGIAIDALGSDLPALHALRPSALRTMVERFAPEWASAAEARRQIVRDLVAATGLGGPPDIADALEAAAVVLDIGRGVDYYNRERHAETLLQEHGLVGWSHRELALICALVRQAHSERYTPTAYRPLVAPDDRGALARAGGLLALADEIVRRRPTGDAGIEWRRDTRGITLTGPHLAAWPAGAMQQRFERAFGLELHFEAGVLR